MTASWKQHRKGAVSAAAIRSEGVLEVGFIQSFAYVLTQRGCHLFHVDCVFARGTATW